MSTKRQTTFAKMQREQAVKERRARKQLRRQERLDEKKRAAEGLGDTAVSEELGDNAVDVEIEAGESLPEHALDEAAPQSA